MSAATPSLTPTDARRDQLVAWLESLPPRHAVELESLAIASADASFRRYFRVQTGPGTRIVMDAPPGREDVQPFVHVAQLLRAAGLNAPEVFEVDAQQAVTILYAGGFPPPVVEARLAFFAEHAEGWWAVTSLMVFTGLLYVPFFLVLYHALRGFNKHMMLLAFACAGLFVVLDLAVTWTAFPSLIILSGNYAGATSDAQRAIIVASAGYPSTIVDSPLSGIYATLIPALGLLFASLVMRKGIFSMTLAFMGVVAGICGILAGIGPLFIRELETFQYINASLALIWFFFVGFKLYKLA